MTIFTYPFVSATPPFPFEAGAPIDHASGKIKSVAPYLRSANNLSYTRTLEILRRELDCSCMNGVCVSLFNPSALYLFACSFSVSIATLDIICATAFGYDSDSLHNPHNELAEAYDILTSSQNGTSECSQSNLCYSRIIFDIGPDLARFIGIVSIPGMTRFLSSRWATRNRHIFTWISFTSKTKTCLLCPLKRR